VAARALIRIFLTLALVLALSPARAIETAARAAIVVDYGTGLVLMEKNADTPLPPASMSKLMTIYMVFEALEDGRLTLDEKLPVSERAMRQGGSSMFLNTRDRVTVEDLIRGVVVLSGNDATVVLAEALAGSEDEFARAMTRRARALGMTNSTFANSNGMPDPGQRMSARDLATLAAALIRDFPQYYPYFGETEFAFDGRTPANTRNRNPLLRLGIGADGLKTGYTDEAGYGLVGSAIRNGRRVIVMVNGLDSMGQRAREGERLINWAFRQFVEKKILDAGQEFGSAEVWLGEKPTVALETGAELVRLLPASVVGRLSGEITLIEPVAAPIEKGRRLATLRIDIPGMDSVEVPLLAAESVAPAGYPARLGVAAIRLAERLRGLIE